METDAFLLGLERCHQLADRVENRLELGIVPLLQRVELPGEAGVGGQHPAEADERPHDLHIDLHRPAALEHAGEHGDALFGERIGRGAPPAQLEVTNCDFKFANSSRAN